MAGLRTDNCLKCVSYDYHDSGIDLGQVYITQLAPIVIQAVGNTRQTNDPVVLSTTGALPSGLSPQTTYYAIPVDRDNFQVAAIPNGPALNGSGGQSGMHTAKIVVLGCHKGAPIADGDNAGKWRPVKPDWWCREFEPLAPIVVREVLTAARTYYVRTDGSDANTGLGNTSAGAFLTIQGALNNIAAGIDLSIYDVTIQVADGTYSSTSVILLPEMVGTGRIFITGNVGTPANVVVTTTGSAMGNFRAINVTTTYFISGLKLTSTSGIGTQSAISSQYGSNIIVNAVEFGSGFFSHLYCGGGFLTFGGACTISAGATYHIQSTVGGIVIINAGVTVTVTGTPAFYIFANADQTGMINASGTYSGTATGSRYMASMNGVINTGGGGANYFPGNVAGTTATGGQYA